MFLREGVQKPNDQVLLDDTAHKLIRCWSPKHAGAALRIAQIEFVLALSEQRATPMFKMSSIENERSLLVAETMQ